MDRILVRMSGQQRCLWGTVDHDGEVVDVLLQERRLVNVDAIAHPSTGPIPSSPMVPTIAGRCPTSRPGIRGLPFPREG